MKRAIKQFFKTNYYLVKTQTTFGFYIAELRGQEPLIVYQMGKVGSSTIVASLKALDLDMTIHHVHTLTQEGIDSREKIYREITKNSHSTYFPRAKHLLSSRYLRKQMGNGSNDKKWKVITLVRDPIAINLSAFFQTIDYPLPDFNDQYQTRSIAIETAIETFLEKYQHRIPLTWFDHELKPVFGIDVFASEFPKSKGYKIYQGEKADVLLLKLETLNKCVVDAFNQFLGIKQFNLIRANVADEKEYATAYKRFKDLIVLPETYIDELYTSQYTQHFYSEEEISKFRAKWSQTKN